MKHSDFDKLVSETRSVRRFKANEHITNATLRELVNLARLTPSSRNRQPLKYIIVNSSEARAIVFSCLNWAKALSEWGGPAESERPSAYVIILGDLGIVESFSVDPGISAQTIMLGARARGLGGCILASVDRDKLRAELVIADRYEILLALALGVPAETVKIEPMPSSGEYNYWRDEEQIHHVPKRSLEEIVIGEYLAD